MLADQIHLYGVVQEASVCVVTDFLKGRKLVLASALLVDGPSADTITQIPRGPRAQLQDLEGSPSEWIVQRKSSFNSAKKQSANREAAWTEGKTALDVHVATLRCWA